MGDWADEADNKAFEEMTEMTLRKQKLEVEHICPDCGAEAKLSKKGNWYCSEICWENY